MNNSTANKNDKVKSVRLYKIGGYQASASNEINHDSKDKLHMRKNHFKDPRNFYFNPYMPSPANPSRFQQPYRKPNMPSHPKFHNQYYQGNNYFSWNDPRMMLYDNHDDDDDSDDEYEADESEEEEEADTDLDDEEEEEEEDEGSDDTEEENQIKKTDNIQAKNNKNPEPKVLIDDGKKLIEKFSQTSNLPNNTSKENELKEKTEKTEKTSIPVINKKAPTENDKVPDKAAISNVEKPRPRSSRVFPIKGTIEFIKRNFFFNFLFLIF